MALALGHRRGSQVELHGHYSLERFLALQRYSQSQFSRLRSLLVLIFTPLPCLLGIISSDLVPHEPSSSGYKNNHVFWLRVYTSTLVTTISFMLQFRHTLPMIPMTHKQIVGISVVVATGGFSCSYPTAGVIGFPVPFMVALTSPAWIVLFGGLFIREHPEIVRDVKNCLGVFMASSTAKARYPNSRTASSFRELRTVAQHERLGVVPT